jgi:DNA-binding MarR family transcriptional regulator
VTDATGTSPEEWAVWRAFLAAHAQLSREIDRRLRRDYDIGQGEYGALAAILDAPGRRLRIGELAELLGWEKSRASHLVTRMEERGLVARQESADDRRATDIVPTRLGVRTLTHAARRHAADVRSVFFSQMTSEERDVVATVLTRILQNLEAVTPNAAGSGNRSHI